MVVDAPRLEQFPTGRGVDQLVDIPRPTLAVKEGVAIFRADDLTLLVNAKPNRPQSLTSHGLDDTVFPEAERADHLPGVVDGVGDARAQLVDPHGVPEDCAWPVQRLRVAGRRRSHDLPQVV